MSEPVVLVPGLLCTAEVFTAQAVALWPAGPVTIASTASGETVADLAAATLRDAPPRFALAGISFGGYVSLEIIRQAPGRVTRLALLDTSARPDTAEQSHRRRLMLADARQHDFGPWVEQALTSIMHPSRHSDPALRVVNRRMGVTIGLQGFARQTEAAIGRADSRPGLSRIDVPTLVLVGEDDKLIPPEHSREIAAAVPHAELVVIPGSGHSTTLEEPELVSSALLAWMRR